MQSSQPLQRETVLGLLERAIMRHKNSRLVLRIISVSLALVLSAGAQKFPTEITRVAGGGSVNNVPATSSPLKPFGVVSDAAGNLFICEVGKHRVRKVDTNGIITTIAGNGTTTFSGDGGPATSAGLSYPESVAVDPAGNLFIADTLNERIRKVDSRGIITTVAGSGQPWTPGFSGDNGPATSARLASPREVVVDPAGNLFINDAGNARIRKVDTNGIITTVAGNGTRAFSGDNGPATNAGMDPGAPAVDGAGNIFIADVSNQRLRKVDSNGIITTVAGNGIRAFSGDNGPATNASLSYPEGVAVDPAGNLFVADSGNARIRKIAHRTKIITTVAGDGNVSYSGDGGPATHAGMEPIDVALDGYGDLLLVDSLSYRVRKVDHRSQIITTVAGNGDPSGDTGPATSASLESPMGVAVDGAGNLFIADTLDSTIRKVDANGIITTIAGTSMDDPFGVAVDSAGNLFIADPGFFRIFKVDTKGNFTTVAGNGPGGFSGDGGPATSAQLNHPDAVAVDRAGNLFIADTLNGRVRKVDTSGIITTVAGNGTDGSSGDGGPATSASLTPSDVALDGRGNLYIADSFNNRVRKVDPGGVIETVVGSGDPAFSGDGGPATSAGVNPSGVRVDNAGNLFIADSGNNRIRKVDTTGIISTVAGDGVAGFSGDGSSPTSASLHFPSGLAVDSAGNIFIADTVNNRIRKVFTPPNFIIASSPSSATIKAGQTAAFTLTITPGGGFKRRLSLNCSGLPAFSSCTFTPASVTPNGSAVTSSLVVTTTGPTPRGTSKITVTALDHRKTTHVVTVTLTVSQ
jgi:sugar lactone lactonase YvrE